MKRRGPRLMVIVLITVVLAVALILTALPGTTRARIGDFFGRLFDPVTQAFSDGMDHVRGFFNANKENQSLRQRVTELEEEQVRLRLEIEQHRDKIDTYEHLKDALHLVERFDDYRVVGAPVLNGPLDPTFDLWRIYAGRRDGVTVTENRSMPVVDAETRLVGRVHSTEIASSKVMPLTHEAFAVSARVEGAYRSTFRVRGDLSLRGDGLCIADEIAEGTPVRVGDRLVTSGEGGIFPEGIVIGEVIEVREDAARRSVTCVVKPLADVEHLTHVFVLMETDDAS